MMIKIMKINKRKDLRVNTKIKIYNIIIAVLFIYILFKMTCIMMDNYSIKLFEKNFNHPLVLDERILVAALEDTLPNSDELIENGEHSLTNFFIEAIFDIKSKDLTSLIEASIPYVGYITELSNSLYTQSESMPLTSNPNSNEKESNVEEVYKGIVQDEFTVYTEENHDKEYIQYTFNQLNNIEFLRKKLYTVDESLNLSINDFDIDYYMKKNLEIDIKGNSPKILIFHTHSQEAFEDSRKGNKHDTVVGVGEELTKILYEKYGVRALHHQGEYDVVDGALVREGSYERVEPAIKEILEKYPSVEILIDIHRDGIEGDYKLLTEVNGKKTARIMFFNGLCKVLKNGKMTSIEELPNPYIKENLAMSFNMQLMANKLYPGFTRKIYLKNYRYSLHMKPKSLLVEVGAQNNTIEEAKNAMEPLAEILVKVLSNKA